MKKISLLFCMVIASATAICQGVGINTTTPKSMLDVEGNVAIGATYSGTTAAPVNGLIIEGSVGIGTTSPTQMLHLQNTGNVKIFLEADTDNATETEHPQVLFSQDGGIVSGFVGFGNGTNNMQMSNDYAFVDGDIDFLTQSAVRMTIDGSGNVGIGTTAPTTALDVNGSIRFRTGGTTNYVLVSDASGNGTWTDPDGLSGLITGVAAGSGLTGGGASGTVTVTADANNGLNVDAGADKIQLGGALTETTTITLGANNMIFNMTSTGDFHIQDNGAAGFTILDNGNVGIGTTTPGALLHTNGGAARFERSSESVYINPNYLGSGTHAVISTGIAAVTSTMDLRLQAGNDDSGNGIILKSTGLVGIGRSPTTNALEVNGNASKSSAGDWLANSDRRLKKDIESLDSEQILQMLLRMRGVSYYWNDTVSAFQDSRPKDLQYGFIAQEVQEVMPDFVTKDGEGYLQMAYGTFDPFLIEAFKAQHRILMETKKQLSELDDEVKRLNELLIMKDIH